MPRSDLFPLGLYTPEGPLLNIDPSLSVMGEIEDGQKENYERGKGGERETSSGKVVKELRVGCTITLQCSEIAMRVLEWVESDILAAVCTSHVD